jgi:sensor histidine kinase YesM
MKKKSAERWFIIIGIPLVAFIAAVVFYSDEWISSRNKFGICFLSSLLNTTIFWVVNLYINTALKGHFGSIRETRKRIFLQLLLSTIASVGLSLIITYYFDRTGIWQRSLTSRDYIYNIIVVLFFVYFTLGIYEMIFYFSKWQQTVVEAEELKKANLQSQFDSLRNQVSPHFLFNSLNTLSSLIEEDSQSAVLFVNQLSRVYRYLLQSNEKELTTLREELDFLDAYFFLLKTRFGDGISLDIRILPDSYQSLIPPLTLQILVENAVKHNVVSASKPLKISIYNTEPTTLTITNNFQKKTVHVTSNGMGLANIAAKFKLLNQPEINIQESETAFIVSLPLIHAKL